MGTLHVCCDFWEQSVSRALQGVRGHGMKLLVIEHIYPENLVPTLKHLVERAAKQDHLLIVLMQADSDVLAQAGRVLRSAQTKLLAHTLVVHSRYSPEIGVWAESIGLNHETNSYEASRHLPWEQPAVKHAVTMPERRWIQYRLMRALIAGEYPATIYGEIFKKLCQGRLSEKDINRSQHFYERDEPDMAGGNWAEGRLNSPNAIDLLRERAVQVGRAGINTLIIGETGTGKESLAWYLHDYSNRCDSPFLALNCAFFEGERLESELFGHELGAFTDAKRMKRGLVEEADGGTLFLDELPEMSPRVQAKLLRFLQDGTYTRLGGIKLMRASVRIISAAQPDRMGTLRQDLYYRVADVELHTVPLRDMKKSDIANIACNLAYRLMWRPIITEDGEGILTPDIIRRVWQQLSRPEHAAILAAYDWPGNMRELSTRIKQFVLLNDDIFSEIGTKCSKACNAATYNDEWQRFQLPISSLEDLQKRSITLKGLQPAFVRHVVASLGGRKNVQPTKLSEALGCSYNTLMSCLGSDH